MRRVEKWKKAALNMQTRNSQESRWKLFVITLPCISVPWLYAMAKSPHNHCSRTYTHAHFCCCSKSGKIAKREEKNTTSEKVQATNITHAYKTQWRSIWHTARKTHKYIVCMQCELSARFSRCVSYFVFSCCRRLLLLLLLFAEPLRKGTHSHTSQFDHTPM